VRALSSVSHQIRAKNLKNSKKKRKEKGGGEGVRHF
jgi:hypothetical protein